MEQNMIKSSRCKQLLYLAMMLLFTLLLSLKNGYSETGNEPLTLHSAFDLPLVDVKAPGERIIELLVTADNRSAVPDTRRRIPLNLALVIDTSGSMSSDSKLESAKLATKKMIDKLQPGDRFSLISYNTTVQVLIPSEPVEELSLAYQLIDSLTAKGSTNLGDGLQEGYRQVRSYYRPKYINRVFLLSDGLANRGITSPNVLANIAENAAQEGISLSTFGVGLEFNEDLMAELSERGRGMYYYINDPEHTQEFLAHEFNSVLNMAARDVQLTLRLDPSIEILDVYANSFQRQIDQIQIQAGDLSMGELRRIHIRFRAPRSISGKKNIGSVEMRYSQPGLSKPHSTVSSLDLLYGNYGKDVEQSRNRIVSERSYVFVAHYARSRAATAIDNGDIDGARKILKTSIKKLQNSSVDSLLIQNEIHETKAYMKSLNEKMSRKERVRIQKRVKYKSYTIEGC